MALWFKILGGGLVVAAISWTVLQIREDGARSVTQAIERQNNEAGARADDGRSDFDMCPDRLWDFGAGRCRRAP